MVELDWQAVVSAGLSGLGVTGIAKYFIQRSAEQMLSRMEELPEKFSEIKSQLAVITNQLKHVENLRDLVHEHDRLIARISAKLP